MAPIISLEVHQDRAFRFLWIKYVTGFNPRVHCARCLLGKYSKWIPFDRQLNYLPRMRIDNAPLDEHAAKYVYLCGVTRRWEWNLHVVGRFQRDARFKFADDRISVDIANFEQLPIDPAQSPDARKAFAKCRNWQFGWCGFPATPRGPDLFDEIPWTK